MSLCDPLANTVSIIIATYNRKQLLKQTLGSITGLRQSPNLSVEVIVCDDGSDDDTLGVVQTFEKKLNVSYCYQPRRSGRIAAARNRGIRLATGKMLLFLDSDVLVCPDLINEHLSIHALVGRDAVVMGPTWGYRRDDAEVLRFVHEASDHWWEEIGTRDGLADPRMSVFRSVDFHLDTVPAPWVLCWGSNVSVSRQAVLEVGGYDESIGGWGGEDTDFAYRLHAQGLSFFVAEKALTLHLPHDSSFRLSEYKNYENKRMIYTKTRDPKTELVACISSVEYNDWLIEIDDVAKRQLYPDYRSVSGNALRLWCSQNLSPQTYLLGANGDLAVFLGCCGFSYPNEDEINTAKSKYPSIDSRFNVGVNTGLDPASLSSAIITDYWRAFPERVAGAIIVEGKRIAGRAFVLYTPSFEVRGFSQSSSWSIERLNELLRIVKLRVVPVAEVGETMICEILPH